MVDDDPAMIANPYRAALAAAVERARQPVGDCYTALDNALLAMRGQAWVSRMADAFSAELSAQDRRAGQVAQDCIDALQQAHDRQPEQVRANSAEAHWQKTYEWMR